MAAPLKLMYSPAFFETICPVLNEVIPDFEERAFIYSVFDKSWPDLELKQRVRHIALALHPFMPARFQEAAPHIIELWRRLEKLDVNRFACSFLADYVEVFGMEEKETAIKVIEEVTKLVSQDKGSGVHPLFHNERLALR